MLLLSLLFACADPCREAGTICTMAGDGLAGWNGDGHHADESRLYYPMDVAWRPGTDEWVVVDWNNERLRRVGADGVMATVVGSDLPGDGDPAGGDRVDPGASGTNVAMNHPLQAEFAPDGQMYVAAWHNHKIRRWDPDTGLVRVVVANLGNGTGNNGGFSGDGGPAEDAQLWFPSSVAFLPDGSYVLTDEKNLRIRRVALDGTIDTVAGCGEPGEIDGAALEAAFLFPDDATTPQPLPGGAIEVDEDGVIWVADTYNGAIRRVDLDAGVVTTLDADVTLPADVEIGPDGRLYVADIGAHRIVAIDRDSGATEVVAGTGEAGDGEEGGRADETALNSPYGIDLADDGALWIADTFNSRIRRVTP